MQNPNHHQIAAFEAFIRERLPLSSDLLSEALVWIATNIDPDDVYTDEEYFTTTPPMRIAKT